MIMALHNMLLQSSLQFINHAILSLLIITTIFAAATSSQSNFPVAKSNCLDRCGNISIPFPFGTAAGCYHHDSFFVTCNQTAFNPPKLFYQNSSIEITEISLQGQLKLLQVIARDCYARNGSKTYSNHFPMTQLPEYLTVNDTVNKFTVVGCDSYANLVLRRQNKEGNHTLAGAARCYSKDDLEEGTCLGLGCSQFSIFQDIWSADIELKSFSNYSTVYDFNDCGYAFLAEETAFKFSKDSFDTLKNVEKLPLVVDWAIGNVKSCEEAKMNSSAYACKSPNSECYKPKNNSDGYRCRCSEGFHGNPYLIDGCQDKDECEIPSLHQCKYKCVNTDGGFECHCPEGTRGDGKIEGEGCVAEPGRQSTTLKLVAGVSVGAVLLLLVASFLYLEHKRRMSNKMKRMFFLQNGGALLQEKLNTWDRSPNMVKIFSSSELQKATNSFQDSMIIGQGGFGTVYKGLLPEDNRVVAIKKSKKVNPNQIEQFINEVIVLSQINHRNVVRLLGCCLETEVPLLVYEFISNGTLASHINNHAKAHLFTWDMRLKIAAETAGVLAYLHSAASTPIIHRDIKSANILLDHTFTAKVSDFGASKLVPLDHTQLSTMVQGTFGYLDPEYMQTNQLTEKSDVYSFGVVLLELLTGRKAISFDKPEEEKNLANFFLYMLKQEQLLQIMDDNIVPEINRDQIMEVARLAQGCLNVRGEDRPSMKQVAMELEGLRLGGKHSWAQSEDNAEEMEYLLGEGLSGFTNGDGRSDGYDSVRSNMLLSRGR